MATLIRATDGSESTVRPKTTEGFSLQEVYDLIGNGCDIVETVQLNDGRIMLLDEEGKIRNDTLIVNEKATRLLAEAGGIPGDAVVGNVLIVNELEFP